RYREARHNTRPVAPSGLQVSFLLCSTLTSTHSHNGYCTGLWSRLYSEYKGSSRVLHFRDWEERTKNKDGHELLQLWFGNTFPLSYSHSLTPTHLCQQALTRSRLLSCPHVPEDEEQVCEADPDDEEGFGSDCGSAHREDLLEGDLGLGADPPAIT
ncbi:hypothetical protein KUCAC02_017834, partial [Chaenocephalus aceratus]